MKGTRGDDFFLLSMMESIDSILDYSSVGRDAFMSDPMRRDAVICRLGVLGEAAKGVSEDVKSLNPDIPWQNMRGLRNILVHNYFGVDLEILWTII